MDRGNSIINTTADPTALLTNNASLIYDSIFNNDVTHIGNESKRNFREHIKMNFFTITPEQQASNIGWGTEISFVFPKQRLITRQFNLEVNWAPGSLVDSTQAQPYPARTLQPGEYIRYVPFAPVTMFQEKYNILFHGGNTRAIQKLLFSTDIIRKYLSLHPIDRQQWLYNLGSEKSNSERQFDFFNGVTHQLPLEELYFDQRKHEARSAFIPSAFTSQFELHFVLAPANSYVLQTNIARAADIVLPIPTIKLTVMMDEVGPTLFNQIRENMYFSKPIQEMHFVHVENPSPIAIPISNIAQDVSFDITKLTTKDVRSVYFFITTDNHLNASGTGASLYQLQPYDFEGNCLKINSFRFTIQNTNATIPISDNQNRHVSRQFFSPMSTKNVLSKGFVYFYNFGEFPWDRNVSSGSQNMNSKTNYNIVVNVPPTSVLYYMYFYFDTENIMTVQNSDIAPALII